MKYSELNLGQIEALANRLGGMEGVRRFLSGETTVTATKVATQAPFVWRRIKFSTGLKTTRESLAVLKMEKRIWVEDHAVNVLGQPAFSEFAANSEVDLVVLTTTELVGSEEPTTIGEVFAGAKRLNLEMCPAAVAPQLRLQYTDQPMGEHLVIGMGPIGDPLGYCHLFRVSHTDKGLGLDTILYAPGFYCLADMRRWVFMRREW